MPVRFSTTAKVVFADKERVVSALAAAARRLAAADPRVRRVLLFGSYARENYTPSSDADILVLLDGSELPFPERVDRYLAAFSGCGVACDLFPYVPEEVARAQEEGCGFIAGALQAGFPLFERVAMADGLPAPADRPQP